MKITITNKMRNLAADYQKKIIKHLKKTPNYTGLSEPDRFYYGTLGEFVFLQYCKERGLKCNYNFKIQEESNSHDFVMFLNNGAPVTVDVKTATKIFHKNLMMPKTQYDLYSYNYYVAVRLINSDSAQIHGYCYKTDFLFEPKGFLKGNEDKTPTCYVPFIKLNSMESFESLMLPGFVKQEIVAVLLDNE